MPEILRFSSRAQVITLDRRGAAVPTIAPMARAYLSLGSNLEPERHLRFALDALRERFGEIVISPAYRTPAVGFAGPDFINLAVGLDTSIDPETLDAFLHALEDRACRRRDVPRFSSRTLDLDLLLYDDRVLRGAGNLELPRPELAKHAFVLQPMADIAPDVVHPTLQRTLAELWREHPDYPGAHATALQSA
jgi:2-amino-4-hydroxy-6-hydroxymethyldihydropteridine diphosphokinase